MKRNMFLLAAVAVPALLAAGCSSASPVAAAPTTTAAAPTETTLSPTATKSVKPIKTVKPTKAGTDRCHTADLTVTKGTGDGAAGTSYLNLVFTDKSAAACTLYGYPGVSWVTGDNGTQVNTGFTRESGGTKATVTLKPHQVAHATVALPTAGNFEAATCKPVAVRGLRVYPPDETTSIFVSLPATACSAKGVGTGRVRAIASGPGDGA